MHLLLCRRGGCLELAVDPVMFSSGGCFSSESLGVAGSSVLIGSCLELTEGACRMLELLMGRLLFRRGSCLEPAVEPVICSSGGCFRSESVGVVDSFVTGSCLELIDGVCWIFELPVSLLLFRRGGCLELDVCPVLCCRGRCFSSESVGVSGSNVIFG